MKTRYRIYRRLALLVVFSMLTNVFSPTVAWALTSGPNAPEFSSFEPVATTDMVNTFGGDFTYNLPVLDIPGPDGAGYSMSLSYHSGASIEEEASWVGYGWSLNPGSINRSLRGFPDEYDGETVHQYNKTRPNWSASVRDANNAELTSIDVEKPKLKDGPWKEMIEFTNSIQSATGLAGGFSKGIRFNNYQGFTRFKSYNLTVKGFTGSVTTSATGTTYSIGINIVGILSKALGKLKKSDTEKEAAVNKLVQQLKDNAKIKNKFFKNSAKMMTSSMRGGISGGANSLGSTHGLYSYSEVVRASTVAYYEGKSVNWAVGASINPGPIPIGYQKEVQGNFNMQWGKDNVLEAYGYMHMPIAESQNYISDYYVEKAQAHNKRDLYLGIPFNNADNFTVTGEGLSGGFKYYPENLRQAYPTQIKSKTSILQFSPEFDFGAALGIGVDFAIGFQKSQVKTWDNMGYDLTNDFNNPGNGGVFRFNNDLGGSITYGNNNLVAADLNVTSKIPGAKSAYVSIDNNAVKNQYTNTGNATYIQKIDSSGRIGGFTICNQNGVYYQYAQPVFNRNDVSLQIDASLNEKPSDKYLLYKTVNLNNDFEVNTNNHNVAVGEVRPDKYASNFLLTKILSPDYVDAGELGLDENDFGSWTSFGYHKKYGGSEWYRWRTPYTGVLYQEGEVSNTKDNVGTMQTGEKEVFYLKVIETKSHIAYFVTNKSTPDRYAGFPVPEDTMFIFGSQQDRLDAMGAGKITGSVDPAAGGTKGNQKLEYLEKIVIFSKDRMSKPLKVVNFEYDYTLAQNLPNNVNGNFPDSKTSANSGKLTLKKVWFEYEGTFSARISPYEFVYKYKDVTEFPVEILNRYQSSGVLASNLNYSDLAQNPDYDPRIIDAWGNVQMYGKERQLDMNPWPYQGVYPATPNTSTSVPAHWQTKIAQEDVTSYDPAAWQLKQIKLPSGGEILIEYEQHEYAYVQDRPVMAMTSLLGYNEDDISGGDPIYKQRPEYYINLSDLGLEQSVPDFSDKRDTLIKRISEYYDVSRQANKIKFKFLYNLSASGNIPDLDKCYSEFLEGYAKYDTCMAATYNGQNCIKIVLSGEGSSNGNFSYVPRKACYDFAATQRVGKDYDYTRCISEFEKRYDPLVAQAITGNTNFLKFNLSLKILENLVDVLKDKNKYGIPEAFSVCTSINPRLSYLKIPMLNAKRGGGVRVKRLLMYDPGIENGLAAVYGSEYSYTNADGTSSGVATTEPSSMRDENPMVTFLPRKDQSAYSRLTAGQDKEQTEGFLGESILPGASVGYSRVVIKNIHSGKTGTGFSVQEYFTVKDFPIDGNYIDGKGADQTPLSDNRLSDIMTIPAGLFNYSTNKLWLTQGYRFLLNSMHGQMKHTATYGGDFDDPETWYMTASQTYEYYKPGERVNMVHRNSEGDYIMKEVLPGREMEVAMEMNAVHDNTIDISLEVDITIGIPTLNITVGAMPTISINEEILRTHATSKIIHYPALIKKVTSFKDGATSTTENLAFNRHTGDVVVTRTHDSFHDVYIKGQIHNGYIYNITIPASWHYSEMGQKALDPDNTNQLSAQTGSLVSYGTTGNPLVVTSDSILNWFSDPQSVLSASVQTFRKNWTSSWNNELIDEQYGSSLYAADLNTTYRPHRTYVFKTGTVSANNGTNKIYNSGMMENFQMYWDDTTNFKWIKANEVTLYSPNGSVVEEKNVLNVYSAAKFGYSNKSMPVMIARNADYSSLWFEDYENNNAVVLGIAHSGSKSLEISSEDILITTALTTGNTLSQRGALLKFWLREDPLNTVPLELKAIVSGTPVKMERVAQTGEWTLYSAELSSSYFSGSSYTILLQFDTPSNGSIYVDDVKIQPLEATATCYVYEVATLRLLAQFDDNHFGMFYQYNNEGKLVRKMIETEKGLRLVQENQYTMPRQQRTP